MITIKELNRRLDHYGAQEQYYAAILAGNNRIERDELSDYLKRHHIISYYGCINNTFSWHSTPESHAFWAVIAHDIEELLLPPYVTYAAFIAKLKTLKAYTKWKKNVKLRWSNLTLYETHAHQLRTPSHYAAFLHCSFIWSETPEGTEYWSEIATKLDIKPK